MFRGAVAAATLINRWGKTLSSRRIIPGSALVSSAGGGVSPRRTLNYLSNVQHLPRCDVFPTSSTSRSGLEERRV